MPYMPTCPPGALHRPSSLPVFSSVSSTRLSAPELLAPSFARAAQQASVCPASVHPVFARAAQQASVCPASVCPRLCSCCPAGLRPALPLPHRPTLSAATFSHATEPAAVLINSPPRSPASTPVQMGPFAYLNHSPTSHRTQGKSCSLPAFPTPSLGHA